MTQSKRGRSATPTPVSMSPPGRQSSGLMGINDLEDLLSRLQEAIAKAHEAVEAARYNVGIPFIFCCVATFFVILGLSVDTALVYQVTASSWRDLAGNIPGSAIIHVILSSAQGVVAVLGLHFVFKYLDEKQIRGLILIMAVLIGVFVLCLGITSADIEWAAHQARQGGDDTSGFLLEAPAENTKQHKNGFIPWLAFWGMKITPFLILPIVTVLFLEVTIENFKKWFTACAEWNRVSNKIKSLNEKLEACYTMKGSLEVAKTQLGFDLFYMKSCTTPSDLSNDNLPQ